MSLVTEAARALVYSGKTDPFGQQWLEGRGAQESWDQEVKAQAMARLCACSDLILGLRIATAVTKKKTAFDRYDEEDIGLAEEWLRREPFSYGRYLLSHCTNFADTLYYTTVVEYPADLNSAANAGLELIKSVALTVRNARGSYSGRMADVIREICPNAPRIHPCRECHRPAAYFRGGIDKDRPQVHWRPEAELACRPSRLLAEDIRAGYSPVSLVFEKRRIVARHSPLEWLEEAAESSMKTRNVQNAKAAWERVKRVQAGEPWDPKFLERR